MERIATVRALLQTAVISTHLPHLFLTPCEHIKCHIRFLHKTALSVDVSSIKVLET